MALKVIIIIIFNKNNIPGFADLRVNRLCILLSSFRVVLFSDMFCFLLVLSLAHPFFFFFPFPVGSTQEAKGLNRPRNQCEDQQICEVVRSYSISKQQQLKMPCNTPKKSKSSKHRSLPSHADHRAQSRYQNAGKEAPMDQDPAYVEPISVDYYNCRKFLRPASGDSLHSYQNIAGPSNDTGCGFPEMGIYENSAAVKFWQTSPGSESSSDDDEPHYINAGLGCLPKSRFPA
ncbi:linker for activation of T-cells family member 2 isoform X2 [Paroedura picta]|uniref:linker for activation of T-cells family member 2 isoform X2 n=1 Tax=Paroedura picta TaxID=143630 RepID=UPI004056C724